VSERNGEGRRAYYLLWRTQSDLVKKELEVMWKKRQKERNIWKVKNKEKKDK
jgi:hypothetical protein